jgi:uncharacterized delta-60 repeat protein
MINDLLFQADGKILVSGELSKIENMSIHGVTRIDALGWPDDTFTPPVVGSNDTVTAIVQHDNGKIIVGGTYLSETGTIKSYLEGLDADGTASDWFTSERPDGHILSLLEQQDGKLLVGGGFSDLKGSKQNALARLTPDFDYDSSFKTRFHAGSLIHCLAQQSDGKILAGGNFSHGSKSELNKNLIRFNPDGSVDDSFIHVVDDWVFAIFQQPNGQIVIGGVFKNINGVERKYLARLNDDGSLDESFVPDMGLIGWVYAMALQTDGRILIGGEFTSINGVDRNHIARVNVDGSLDDYFNPGLAANESVKVIKLQEDGRILIGGEFTSYDDKPRRHIAKINEDGSLDRGFGEIDDIDLDLDDESTPRYPRYEAASF